MDWVPSHAESTSPKRKLAAVLFLLILVAAGTVAVFQAGGSRTDGNTAPAPAAREPNRAGGPAFDSLRAALALDPNEQDMYNVALERERQLRDAALTMWMSRLRRFPRLGEAAIKELPRPSWSRLVTDAKLYGGQAVQKRLFVFRVLQWEPGVDFQPTPRWTMQDGPIWRVDCLDSDAEVQAEAPVMVLMPIDPRPLLGKPVQEVSDRETLYASARDGEVRARDYLMPALVYKSLRDTSEQGEARAYPVLLAWQIGGKSKPAGKISPWGDPQLTLVLGLALVLLFLFVFVKRKFKVDKVARDTYPNRGYTPLRDREDHAALTENRLADEQPQPDQDAEDPGPVDPDLRAAADAYRKEHGDDDEADRPR